MRCWAVLNKIWHRIDNLSNLNGEIPIHAQYQLPDQYDNRWSDWNSIIVHAQQPSFSILNIYLLVQIFWPLIQPMITHKKWLQLECLVSLCSDQEECGLWVQDWLACVAAQKDGIPFAAVLPYFPISLGPHPFGQLSRLDLYFHSFSYFSLLRFLSFFHLFRFPLIYLIYLKSLRQDLHLPSPP